MRCLTRLNPNLLAMWLALVMIGPSPLAAQPSEAGDDLPVLDLDSPMRLNFAGSWEKDFARSDKWEDELNRNLRLRQEQAAMQRAGIGGGISPRVSVGNMNLGSGNRRGSNLFEMAQLAEYINRPSILEIIQDRNEIRIERRGEAPLVCGLEMGPMSTFSSVHGTEICGWDQQQLVFQITLPGDLSIQHRFTVAAEGNELRMVTAISSRGSAPFNLIQTFNRFKATPNSLNCVLTVSRGRVCSQVTPLE
ncbi:MAG: hypothetical protein OXE78_10865 [Gammaproteobacteria bacterium]|nr:hypothetical protein [Gammaproteobacteria bacterium]MCY4358501.1 hypothetical protein [Gammaproteobacteria bacterium]